MGTALNSARHTDPGLLTVLARGTAPGLEMELRDVATATPCCSRNSSYEDVVTATATVTNAVSDATATAIDAVSDATATAIDAVSDAVSDDGATAAAAGSLAGVEAEAEAAIEEKARTREWLLLEPIMKPNQVVVLVGETLARATGGKHPAGLHRVVRPKGLNRPRFNMAYELRPAVGVFRSFVPDGAGDVAAGAGNVAVGAGDL